MVTNSPATDRSVFDAIADPTRRAILDVVRHGETGAGELADRFPISRPAIARHVRILKQAGLLGVRKEAQRRFYSLRPGALAEIDRWLEPYRVFWSARLVDIKRYVEDGMQPEKKSNERRSKK